MLPGRYAVGFSSDSGDVPLMPLLRDEIRDHSAEEMLFIRRAAIAFLLVVVCFGVLIVNLYHLQVEQHDFLPDPVKPERHQNAAHRPPAAG